MMDFTSSTIHANPIPSRHAGQNEPYATSKTPPIFVQTEYAHLNVSPDTTKQTTGVSKIPTTHVAVTIAPPSTPTERDSATSIHVISHHAIQVITSTPTPTHAMPTPPIVAVQYPNPVSSPMDKANA